MIRQARTAVVAVAIAAALVGGATGCSSSKHSSSATAKAEQLVAKAHATGVAPKLTVDTAEALYGTKAPAVCKAFDGGLSTSGRLLLLGNPSGRRTKTITRNAVAYARLVVEIYCPDVLHDFDDAVHDLDPIESS